MKGIKREMKRFLACFFAGALLFMHTGMGYKALAANSTSSNSSSDDEDYTVTESAEPESHDTYSLATSTSPFIQTASNWATPTAKHGEAVFVVLPIVNMFKYDVTDVIVTPVVSTKTEDFPFEIDLTGLTVKVDRLLGEEKEPDMNKRARDCVWLFNTRKDVKTGYYKIDYSITYTNPACVIESCTISTYVKTEGLPQNGTTDGNESETKPSTPRVIVTGFTTVPSEVHAGEEFTLNLTIKNTSQKTAVNNMQLDLTGTVEGKDASSAYAAFLPTSGSNSFYLEKVPAGGSKELSMDFTAKADLEQKPYVMDIHMMYEDDSANSYEGNASVSIPVHQEAKFDTSAIDVQPPSINVGEQSDVMFSIYNTGKTKLYNVSVSISADSVAPALAYLGGLDPGATGNVDVMVTGAAATMDDGQVTCVISYEDESGHVTTSEKPILLYVMDDFGGEDYGEEFIEEPEETGMTPLKRNILIGCGAVAAVVVLIIVIRLIKKRKKKKQEEQELKELEEEEDEDL